MRRGEERAGGALKVQAGGGRIAIVPGREPGGIEKHAGADLDGKAIDPIEQASHRGTRVRHLAAIQVPRPTEVLAGKIKDGVLPIDTGPRHQAGIPLAGPHTRERKRGERQGGELLVGRNAATPQGAQTGPVAPIPCRLPRVQARKPDQ